MNVRHNREAHRFEIDLNGALALAAYHETPGTIAFTHTEVPTSHEGQGAGTTLVKAGLAHARDNKLWVVPACRFFASYMKKHPEVHDLLDHHQRKLLGLD